MMRGQRVLGEGDQGQCQCCIGDWDWDWDASINPRHLTTQPIPDPATLTPLTPEVISKQVRPPLWHARHNNALHCVCIMDRLLHIGRLASTALPTDGPTLSPHTQTLIEMKPQATINIGTIGHVAHGKSTVVKAISGVNTVRCVRTSFNF